MRKVILLAALIACFASVSFAQDRAKPEFFAGFSVNSIDTGLSDAGFANTGDRETAFGFETSGTGYFNKSFGIEGNFDGHFKNKTFSLVSCASTICPPPASIDTRLSTFNFMAGPHVRLTSDTESKVAPFVHALVGGNHSRIRTNSSALTTNVTDSETDFALKLGGGLDFTLSPRTALRLSADYNPVFEKDDNTTTVNDSRTRHDAVFSIGIVIK